MSFFGDIFAGKAEQRAAEYNASVIETNKKIKEQEAKQIQSATTTSYVSSGVELSGTVAEALYAQELELQTDRDIMQFNAENARDTAENEAIMMQAEADLQRYRGKVARKASYFAAGQSLLNTGSMFI